MLRRLILLLDVSRFFTFYLRNWSKDSDCESIKVTSSKAKHWNSLGTLPRGTESPVGKGTIPHQSDFKVQSLQNDKVKLLHRPSAWDLLGCSLVMKSYFINICGSKSIALEGNIVEFMETTQAFKCILSVQFDYFCFSPMLSVIHTI